MIPLSSIHEAIERLEGQLEDLVSEITKAAGEAAEAEAEFRSEFAAARVEYRVNHSGEKFTVDMVEDYATVCAIETRTNHLLKANNLLVLREAMRARQAQLDGFRTLAASYRGAGG